MKARVQLLVTVDVDGDYYSDAGDLAAHLEEWIVSALYDRDDIDACGPGLNIERVDGGS